jgi:hypothetical protein
METIKSKLSMERFNAPTTKAMDRRAHLLEQFLGRINTKEREQSGFQAITPARLGTMVAHVDTDDLEAFYKKCCNYTNGPFSKCFFGSLKAKSAETKPSDYVSGRQRWGKR